MARLQLFKALAITASAAIAANANAQSAGRGFLFGPPIASVTLRTGWALANANSDLFAFTTGQLTLNKRDFNAMAISADATYRLLPSTHAVFSLGVAATSHGSEFRDFVDNNQLPIEQTTSFVRVPITVGVRQYLMPTGRTVGRLAWIPSRVAPYVGAGGGVMYYRFKQSGDFIDFQSLDVFASQMVSSGWARTLHALAGADVSLTARVAITTEAKYQWANAELSQDFSGFNRLDLSGLATTVGVTVRF